MQLQSSRWLILGILIAIGVGVFLLIQNSPKLQKGAQTNPTTAPVASPTPVPSTVTIDGHVFTVEVARSEQQKVQGLGNRDSIAQDRGMVFLFDTPDYYGFWMKQMRFALDIIYFQNNKIVTMVQNAQPPVNQSINPQIFKPAAPSNIVLEISGGLSKKYQFKLGDVATFNIH